MRVDWEFLISAQHVTKGVTHTEEDSVLFLAKDKLLPQVLMYYRDLCITESVGGAQIKGVELLIARVEEYQRKNPELCKLPDIDEGEEEAAVGRPNILSDEKGCPERGVKPYNECDDVGEPELSEDVEEIKVGTMVQYKESEKEALAALVVSVHNSEIRNCCVILRVFPSNGETPYPKTGVVRGSEVGQFQEIS